MFCVVVTQRDCVYSGNAKGCLCSGNKIVFYEVVTQRVILFSANTKRCFVYW